jgi:hypothetical protein
MRWSHRWWERPVRWRGWPTLAGAWTFHAVVGGLAGLQARVARRPLS